MEQSRSITSRIRDVLLTELPLPFGSTTERQRDGQLDRVLAQLEQRGRVVGDLLVSKGIVTEEQLEQVARHQQRLKCSWTQAMVDLQIIPPSAVSNIAAVMERELRDREQGRSLDEVLLSGNHLDAQTLDAAKVHARAQHIPLEQAILETGALTLPVLGAVYQEAFGIGWIDVSRAEISRACVNLVPDNVITTLCLLPVQRVEGRLRVAMADPRNEEACDKLRLLTMLEIEPLLADRRQLLELQKQFVLTFAGEAPKKAEKPASLTQMQSLIDSDSTVKMVEKIVEGALNAHATDIHLEPALEHLRIRYRIDGMLYDIMTIPRDMGIPTISRVKVLAAMDITERRRPQDGRITMTLGDTDVKMRVATLPTFIGEKVVLRILSDRAGLLGLSEIGLNEAQYAQVSRLMHQPYGMLLVTGPIGSGKTTTLYSILHALNQPNVNIVTIEEPVEFPLPGINQVQVDPKSNVDFASGLRAILRQDANVLMVGEIRDAETAQTAVRAAMTGHLLLSTLHTNRAVSAVATLQHMDVKPFLLATCMLGVIAQRLIRKVCPKCVSMRPADAAVRKELGLPANSKKRVPVAVGCSDCHGTGYQGRTAIFEVFELTDTFRHLIAEGASEQELAAAVKKSKAQSLLDTGRERVLAGETTLEEVLRVLHTE